MARKPTVQPIILSKQQCDSLPIQTIPEPSRMTGTFQNIFANESTPTNELTFGIARIPARTPEQIGFLALHRHKPAELYYILSGTMVIILEGVRHKATAGHAIFIPGDAEHGYCNPSAEEELVFTWTFATDGFGGIEIRFSEEQPDWSKVVGEM